jgi:LysM repeat protein
MRIAAVASIIVLTAISGAPARADATEPDKLPDVMVAESAAEPAESASEPVVTSEDEHEGDPGEAPKKSKKSKKAAKAKAKDKSRNDEACNFLSPIHWHRVEAGEHLGVIAGRYGVLSKDLIALNPALAENPNHIRVGQKLAVCPEIPPHEIVVLEHTVAPGETFNEIAYANKLTPTELLEMQTGRLRDPNKLRVGDRLQLVVVGDILPGFEPDDPQPGRLVNARKLPNSDAYTIKRAHNVYGTARTIKLIGKVVDSYQQRLPGGPKLRIGDISKDGGGPMSGHLSHQEGRDVDIGLILQGDLADHLHFSGASADNVDLARTWTLIEEFIATGEVRFIFLDYEMQRVLYEHAKQIGVPKSTLDEYFQYPRGTGRNHGLIRHWRGHRNHIHVRFRE